MFASPHLKTILVFRIFKPANVTVLIFVTQMLTSYVTGREVNRVDGFSSAIADNVDCVEVEVGTDSLPNDECPCNQIDTESCAVSLPDDECCL